MKERERYPLSWPEGWKRTAPSERVRAKFYKSQRTDYGSSRPAGNVGVADAVRRLIYELRRMGISDDDLLISTNIELRLDGMPRSDREPRDPGAAVYWVKDDKRQCMAIDRYDRVADNLVAIAASLEALRAIERHGGGEILDRAFQGFAALPERASGSSWREILQVHPSEKLTADEVKSRFLAMAKKRHPDVGGSEEGFRELVWARDQALLELTGPGAETRAAAR